MGHNKQCENLSNFDYFIISSGWAKYYYIYTYIDDDEDDSDDDRWMDGWMDVWIYGQMEWWWRAIVPSVIVFPLLWHKSSE